MVVHFSLPLPGALIGIAILFCLMTVSSASAQSISHAAKPLLTHMSFFFLPAVLGIAIYWSTLQQNIEALLLALVGTTVFSLCFSYWLAKKVLPSTSSVEDK
ncbi:CidA/LrgA family protein [Alteromonas aquimaris]|uniref:CidA/LrgA family protein n=1 Tax=Alteromonas aquimaris TaxID=2998417 RepID=UPI00387E4957